MTTHPGDSATSLAPARGLDIRLLGRFDVRARDEHAVRILARHAQALFTLLALSAGPRTREAIAADLWPDAGGGTGGPLRQALYQVRQSLAGAGIDPDDVLESCGDTLAIRPSAIAWMDTIAFERCTDELSRGAEAAVALYGGDLAEGLGHECFAAERERLADRYEDALATIATQRLEADDPIGARRAAERLVARDPLREEAHAVLITVHGLLGTRSQVVRQYRRLRGVLERELGEVPLPETDLAYRTAMARVVARSFERAMADTPAPTPGLSVVGR